MASDRYRLTEQEFSVAWDARMRKQKRGQPPKRDILYDALVKGLTYTECGVRHNSSHQSVSCAVRRFMKFYNTEFVPEVESDVPGGYVKETFTLPAAVMAEVKELIKKRCQF